MIHRPLTLLLALAAPAAAQEAPFDFTGRGPYRAEVPRPDSLLGYAPGTRHTQYHAQQAALERLVAASGGRAAFEDIGVTEEGRRMRLVLISSPANLARRDEIRADLARLTDPRSLSPADARAILDRTPVAVFLSYSIHGNEPAGFEAVPWVAYQLVASENPETAGWLDSVLVILNPAANPDGHERFAVWYNSVFPGADGTAEPASYEWSEPWSVWGRYSHYRFDMNRDLIAQSQAPVRAMLAAMRRWNPQVVVDLHSTTEQYFFPPFAEPVNANIPAASLRWVEVFGRGNAQAFDRYGWQYFTRDVFDGHYPGYFDASPTTAGATGMTYETDGGKALQRRRDDNTVITFREGIAHHYVASLATIETAARNRGARLADFQEFYRGALTDAGTGRMKRVVILPDRDQTNAARLASLLLGHGVEVRRLTAPLTATAAVPYFGPPDRRSAGPPVRQTFPAGALVVDLAQPRGRMAKALLEPDADVPADFRTRQLEKFARNQRRGDAGGERYEFYDVTAWSLPYTLGLDAWWTADAAPVAGDLLTLPADGSFRALAPGGGVSGKAQSAYVFPNDRQAAAELALGLLADGLVLNAATEPLRADGRTWPRGTFVARVVRNPERLHERIAALSASTGVPVTAVQSAFPDSGPVGIGSTSVRPVFRPRVLVAAGDGVSQTSYGALWHFLERDLRYPFVPVGLNAIGRMTLSDYNVLIVPGGSAARVRQELGEAGIARLKAWVREGGLVVAWGGAALFLSAKGVDLSTVKRLGEPPEDEKEKEPKGDSLPAAPRFMPPLPSPTADTNAVEPIPGAIFRAALDRTHWLTYGYERDELAVMMSGSTLFTPSRTGANPVAFVGDSLRLSGFTWPNTERLLKGTVWAAVEDQGSGHVVLLADDPLFRAFWRGTARLVTNAILFGTGR
ncbi:MAG TPA: M14 family zinc carboxypeptidase [Gemmatimonadales bacterium]|nr:M14 family zinc carboxypeptidase [Gemmatimonadales bacterium]